MYLLVDPVLFVFLIFLMVKDATDCCCPFGFSFLFFPDLYHDTVLCRTLPFELHWPSVFLPPSPCCCSQTLICPPYHSTFPRWDGGFVRSLALSPTICVIIPLFVVVVVFLSGDWILVDGMIDYLGCCYLLLWGGSCAGIPVLVELDFFPPSHQQQYCAVHMGPFVQAFGAKRVSQGVHPLKWPA